MAAAGSYKQDLPPKGGYAPINYKRIPARQVLNGPLIYAGLFGSMAYGYWQYKRGIKVVRKQVRTSTVQLKPAVQKCCATPARTRTCLLRIIYCLQAPLPP